MQPPLPEDESKDIINRLDRPVGFKTVNNPLHEDQAAIPGQQAEYTQQVEEQEVGEEEWLDGGAGTLPPDMPPDSLSWLARFR